MMDQHERREYGKYLFAKQKALDKIDNDGIPGVKNKTGIWLTISKWKGKCFIVRTIWQSLWLSGS